MTKNKYLIHRSREGGDNDSLSHFGIKGQSWGIRRYQNKDGSLTSAGKKRYSVDAEGNLIKKPEYRSSSIGSAIARRKNEKVDKGFENWQDNAKKKEIAISLGKDLTKAKIAYENDKSNKELKEAYKKAEKEYDNALKENTTYRKGAVRQEVGQDAARKALSAAKKVQKELMKDPNNKILQKKYNQLMSEHAKERAKARKAVDVASKRSSKIASLKRALTMAIKGVATAGVIAAGTVGVNAILKSKGYSGITPQTLSNAVNLGKKVFGIGDYIY